MDFNLNNFLISIATALDIEEMEYLQTSVWHSKRVAFIALQIAKQLGLKKEACADIITFALVHDNGLSEAVLKQEEQGDIPSIYEIESLKEHCVIGERNIKDFPLFTHAKDIILYHHEHYDGSGFFELKGDDIPLMSQILSLSDAIEFDFNLDDDSKKNKEAIVNFLQTGSSILFNPKLVEVAIQMVSSNSFWKHIQRRSISQSLKEQTPQLSLKLNWEQILNICTVFALPQTQPLLEKLEKIAEFYKFDKEKTTQLKIAASLHLLVHKDCIDYSEENPNYYEHFILRGVEGFEDIKTWAFDHDKKDNLEFDLINCLNTYNILTLPTLNKTTLSHEEAIEKMFIMSKEHKISLKITANIDRVFHS